MNRLEIKKAVDREIMDACEMKAVNFNELQLDETFNLLGSGIFDSLGILQLLLRLEEELNADIDLSEYSPGEFTNYENLIKILQKSLLLPTK